MTNLGKYLWIRKAFGIYKKLVIKEKEHHGMCVCFYHAKKTGFEASHFIPEFNPEFLGGRDRIFWWDIIDTRSRIKAFEKLLNIYWNKLTWYQKIFCKFL